MRKIKKVLVITGPTGVGKTALSIFLAKKLNGEIINADSMQVYKDLNIGTAKIKEEEKEGIKHHLLDIKEVDEEYSVFDFQTDCQNKIEEISKKNKLPIIVGGTGLYIKALLYGYELKKEETKKPDYSKFTNEELYEKLKQTNKNTKIHPNNRKRIERALTYNINFGKNIEDNKNEKILYDAYLVGLNDDRKNIYNKINSRVDKMIEEGLIEEVKRLYDKNKKAKSIKKAIGYKELFEYFEDKIALEEAIKNIKQNTRNYAKRQITFFKHQLPIIWYKKEKGYEDKILEDIKKELIN